MMNSAQAALAQPDISWSRNRSPKIEMRSHIQANRIMNQKIETRTSQSDMATLHGRRGTRRTTALSGHDDRKFLARMPHPVRAVRRYQTGSPAARNGMFISSAPGYALWTPSVGDGDSGRDRAAGAAGVRRRVEHRASRGSTAAEG